MTTTETWPEATITLTHMNGRFRLPGETPPEMTIADYLRACTARYEAQLCNAWLRRNGLNDRLYSEHRAAQP